jgi:hypothetical protein
MKPFDIYVIFLIVLFIVGIISAGMTGNIWWLALSVIPAAIFARWMKV